MQSMTGYGKGVSEEGGKKITVELKSVNHRYLDLGIKLPRGFLFLEDEVKKQISSVLSRGHVDVFVNYEVTSIDQGVYTADVALAKNWVEVARALNAELNLKDDVTLLGVMRNQDIVTRKITEDDEDVLRRMLLSALGLALNSLQTMRKREGEALRRDLSAKLDVISVSRDKIALLAPQIVADFRTKLNERIAEAVKPGAVDQTLLATEIALYADHVAVDEELTRLKAHVEHMREYLCDENKPVGRQLDFLVQEMNREANTIGSKAQCLDVTNEVLAIKNEIEKIREQAANVE